MSEPTGNPLTPSINPAQPILSVLTHLDIQTVSQIVVQATSQAVTVAIHNLPTTNSGKITTTLREYKGGKDYQDFKRECLLYILANKRAFLSHKKKILFVLSYLKEGTVAVWVKNWVAQYTDNDDNIYCLNTFQAFINQLRKSFENPSKKETVIQRLRQLKQDFKSVNVFFQQFEILKTKAGLKNEVYDTVLINLL